MSFKIILFLLTYLRKVPVSEMLKFYSHLNLFVLSSNAYVRTCNNVSRPRSASDFLG